MSYTIQKTGAEIERLLNSIAASENVDAEQNRKIENIIEAATGVLLNEQTDATAAYSKTVPNGALKWADVNSISGKSIVLNELHKPTAYSNKTQGGITYTKGNNGEIIISGTATGASFIQPTDDYALQPAHKYLLAGLNAVQGYGLHYRIRVSGSEVAQYNTDAIFTKDTQTEGAAYVRLQSSSNAVYPTPITFKPHFVDLTKMFGSEIADTITTPEQAYALGCPREYTGYNTGEIVSADVKEIRTTKADTTTLDSLAIPDAIRALDGYGQSEIGGNGNTVDFVSKKYIEIGHYVGSVWTPFDEPVETDISSMFSSNGIKVEAGGSVVFTQTSTQLQVPSSVTYFIKI